MQKTKRYPELNALKGKMREEKKTYRSLSAETGLSVDAINNKLNGYSPIDGDDVELFVDALGIEPKQILLYFFPQMLRNVAEGD